MWIALINVAIVLLRGRRHLDFGDRLAARSRRPAGQVARAARRRDGARRSASLRRGRADAGQERRRSPDAAAPARGSTRRRAVGPYLRRSCNTDTIVACAVFEGGAAGRAGRRAAAVGTRSPRRPPSRASASWPCRRIARYAVLGASAQVGGATGRRLFVARLLDRRLAQMLTRARRHADPADQLSTVRRRPQASMISRACIRRACPTAAPRCMRIDDLDLYAASFPVFAVDRRSDRVARSAPAVRPRSMRRSAAS